MASFFKRKKDEEPEVPRDEFGQPIDPDPAGRAYDEWSATASNVPDPDRIDFRRDDPSNDPDPTWDPLPSSTPPPVEQPRRRERSAYDDAQQPDEDLSEDQRANRAQNERRGLFTNRAARFMSTGVPLSMVNRDDQLGGLVEAAAEFGWSVTDSEPLAEEILSSVPVPIHGYRAGNVVSGRFDPFTDRSASGLPPGEWAFTAFDAVEDSKYGRTVRQCFTAVPSVVLVPDLRILPVRFRVGPTRAMVVYPTIDQVFDARYRVMAAHGDEELALLGSLMNDEVRSSLLGAADNEEVWTSGGQLIVSTSTPHNEETLAVHLGILGAMLRALR